MRNRLLALALVAATLLAPTPALALDASDRCGQGDKPHFVFGFADLKNYLGARMGNAVTCEFPDPNGTGDVHQQTSVGLAFWRKRTNTPTFTNGWEHWARTSAGWVTWTGSSIDPPSSATPARAPAPAPSASAVGCLRLSDMRFLPERPRDFRRDGEIIEGMASNRCTNPVTGRLKLEWISAAEDGSSPMAVANPDSVINMGRLEAGEARYFQLPVWPLPRAAYYYWRLKVIDGGPPDGAGLPCWEIPGGGCIVADARLNPDLADLDRLEAGRWLQSVASKAGVVLRLEHLPLETLGAYRPSRRTISLNDTLLAYGFRERAAVLAHELQHAADHAAGKLGTDCYRNEFDAFKREGEVWAALWNNSLPTPTSSFQAQLNDIAVLAYKDPYQLANKYLSSYRDECGG